MKFANLSVVRRSSIRFKLTGAFLLLLVLLAGVSGVQMILFTGYMSQYRALLNDISSANSINGVLKNELDGEIRDIVFGMKTFKDGKQNEMIEGMMTRLRQLDSGDSGSILNEPLESVFNTMDSLKGQVAKLGEQLEAKADYDATNATYEYITEITTLVQANVQEMIRIELLHSERVKSDIQQNFERDIYIFVSSILAAVVVILYITRRIDRSIVQPIKRLNANAAMLAEGNLNVEAIRTNSGDEIGQLCDSFNRMCAQLSHLIHGVREMNGQVAAASDTIHVRAVDNRKSGDAMASASRSISKSTSDQNEIIVSAGQLVDGLFQAFRGILQQSSRIRGHADQSLALALEGSGHIDEFMTRFREVAASLQASSGQAGSLTEASKAMMSTLKHIREIAAETNILSLNASIEAARSRTEGKAFSVVAHRIKQLAEQSDSFAGEVDRMMKRMNEEVGGLERRLTANIGEITEMSELAERSHQVFGSITLSNRNVHDEIGGISRDIEESERRMRSVHERMSSIRSNADRIAEEAASIHRMGDAQIGDLNEVVDTSVRLMDHTRVMSESVQRFKSPISLKNNEIF